MVIGGDLMDNYYTPQQVAEKLQINIRTVYKWIREGKLKAIKIGDLWRISETELKRFVED
jgi:excisionase family DNA binding protein